MNNPYKNTPPKNFYQAQPYTQPGAPSYPYNYLPNQPNNLQTNYPAYQYWNYYQQAAYGYPSPQGRLNNFEHSQPNQQNQRNRNFYNKNNNLRNEKNFKQNDFRNRSFKNNQNKKSKNKIDKRDLPENNRFYCEVCDRGFKTDEKYQEHLATHTTCGINGCKFTAAAKLVEIHFRNFHATGLDKKISNIQTAEDVQKYIDERKKNFPTKENLDKKKQFEKEKSDRGVVLNTREYGKLKNRNKREFRRINENKNEKSGENNNLDKIPRVNERNNLKRKNKKTSLFSRKMEVLKNRYKKPTLLQKLLADEIRHERNILLQCVRYVVEKHFFEK